MADLVHGEEEGGKEWSEEESDDEGGEEEEGGEEDREVIDYKEKGRRVVMKKVLEKEKTMKLKLLKMQKNMKRHLIPLRRILVATVTNEVTKNGNVLFFIRNCKRCHE